MTDELKRRREQKKGHVSGIGHCIDCHFEWDTSAPIGTDTLQCPKCCTERAVWKYPIEEDHKDLEVWHCECENTYFQVVFFDEVSNVQCIACGSLQNLIIAEGDN